MRVLVGSGGVQVWLSNGLLWLNVTTDCKVWKKRYVTIKNSHCVDGREILKSNIDRLPDAKMYDAGIQQLSAPRNSERWKRRGQKVRSKNLLVVA